MNNSFSKQRATLQIVGIYALFSLLWIYTSDTALSLLVPDTHVMAHISIYKGSCFVILTSLLIYFLMNRYNKTLSDSEQALKSNDRYLRTILDTEPECVKMLDANSNLVMMNRAGLEMIEADSFEQVQGQSVSSLVSEPYREAFITVTNQVFQGIPGTLEFEIVGLKGQRKWLDTQAVPFRNEQGEIVALLGITRDITDKKKATAIFDAQVRLNAVASSGGLDDMLQAALDEAETLTGSTIGFFHFLEEDQITLDLQTWSTNTLSSMCTAEGKGQHYPVDSAGVWVDCVRERKPVIHNDYQTLPHKKGLPAGHAPIIRELVVPIIRNNRIDAIIGVGNKPDDYTDRDVEVLSQFASIACDVALRKKAELALKESEFFFKESQRAAAIGSFKADFIADKWESSEILDSILGIDKEYHRSVEGWLDIIHPDDRTMMDEYLRDEVICNKQQFSKEYRIIRKDDGKTRWVNGLGAVSCDSDGNVISLIGTIQDISERKRAEDERVNLEKQLLHAQKLESLGVLAGGIAHDFNNILMTVMGNAELALMRINKESPAVDNLHSIEKATARAADLAKQMLAYSGKGKFVVENLDLNHLLEDMLHMLEVSISKKAVLRFNLHTPIPSVEADATQLRQIIMNLVINASEAIGDKSGVIAITTGCMDCDSSYLKNVWLNENLNKGLYVYLEIADTGCGMDKETLSKLFDPFFSTKFTGRGLGMAAVLGIVRGHKGAINVYSEPKKGTTFKVLLPASSKPAEIFNHDSHSGEWKGHGTVLLIDDEETVRGIGKEMLQELGFTTITANDGREGIELYKTTPGISCVILDLTMPHMDGEQCFRELRKINPDVKVIMSSGYNEQEVTQKFVGKGLAGFIQKPYKLSVLRQVIMDVGS